MKINEFTAEKVQPIVIKGDGFEATYCPSFPTTIADWLGRKNITKDNSGISNGKHMGIIIFGPPEIVKTCIELIDPIISNGLNT